MTGARKRRSPVLAAALLTLLAACSSPQALPSAPGSDAAAPSPAEDPSGGISAEEAKERGVFVNDYDARLQVTTDSGSTAVLTVTNVGNEPDRYSLSVDPVTAGQVTPAELSLDPRERATVSVTLTAPATVRMVSDGRGDEVAAVDVP